MLLLLVGAGIMLIGMVLGILLGAALVLGSKDRNYVDDNTDLG